MTQTYERVESAVLSYMALDSCLDLDGEQVERLTLEMRKLYGDNLVSPQAVSIVADKLFPAEENKMQRVVPPITSRAAIKQTDPEYAGQQIREFIEGVLSGFLVSDEATISPIFQYLQNRPGVRFDHLENFLVVKHGWRMDITLRDDDKVEAKIPLKPVIEAPLAKGWARSNYSRREALDGMVLEQMRNYTDPTSAETFTSIINDLGKTNRWPLNSNGEEQRLDSAIQTAKTAILSLGKKDGRPVWPQWDPRHGKVMWRDAALLDQMSVDELLATIESVSSLHKQMRGSRDDQRERLSDFADASAGLRKYRSGDRTELDGSVQFKQGPGAPYEFVGERPSQVKPTADPRMDRSVPVPANLPPHVAQLFTDPLTQRFYTKTSLHKLARTNVQLFRRMMNSGFIEFMNSLLTQPE